MPGTQFPVRSKTVRVNSATKHCIHNASHNMKKLLLLILIGSPALFAFIGDPTETDRKSPNPCYIEYCKPNASIKKSEARILFTFRSNYIGLIRDSVLMSYNGISKTLRCDSLGHSELIVKPGKYKFQFWISGHEEIYTDSFEIKGAHVTGMAVYFSSTEVIMEVDKPVIYFYPHTSTTVNVKLDVKGQLGFTYPVYNGGWNFTADPDGTLHMNGKEYNYLFWDAQVPSHIGDAETETGFIVDRDSLPLFFEEKLTAMRLNAREQEDFITYWCPRMQEQEKYFVRFLFNDQCNSIASLNIIPKPDHLLRVYMLWDDATGKKYLSGGEQEIPAFTRDGFTVVEWGGARTYFLSTRQASIKH